MKNYHNIIRYAWRAYDHTRTIRNVEDVSALVSTNTVYKVILEDGNTVIAKVTLFGSFENFAEDHTIINVLANNLPVRYSEFLSRALMKGQNLFFHRHIDGEQDCWVIFYRPIQIVESPPRRFSSDQVRQLGREMARFHYDCSLVTNTLPQSGRDMTSDINALLQSAPEDYPQDYELIQRYCRIFLENTYKINIHGFKKIPVFIDWNIGNFSVDAVGRLASRWDYDWFRMSSRVTDFYFLSRVVSDVGDQTVFTYEVDRLMEPRFVEFLKAYHEVFPLSRSEVFFIKESYRFFLLNYVLRLGRFFFRPEIAERLAREVIDHHLVKIDSNFDVDVLLTALDMKRSYHDR